jgi:hypothetical protein
VDVNRARDAAWQSRTGFASGAASHPKNAPAGRNRRVPADRKLLELEIVPLPEWKGIERHRGTIADKDVPVIVSAIRGKCDLLVTGDRKDFGALARKSSLPFRIVTPAECVTQLGMWMEAR